MHPSTTWRSLPALLVLGALLLPTGAEAKLCGDAVGGQDVPCACGDVVASDLVLSDDPVTQEPCASDGLLVRADGAEVTIDLAGRTLRGTGHGAGLWLLSGRARVISTGAPASIEGFQDGILAHGDDALQLIDGVVVVGARRDGLRLRAGAYEVRNVEVRGAGRDGFAFDGWAYRVSATRAVGSHRYGYEVQGWQATLGAPGAGLVAEGSGMAGFWVMGMQLRLLECVATGGMKNGLHLMGMHFEIRDCVATDNGGTGIEGDGMAWQLSGNQAHDNGGDGLVVGDMAITDEGGNVGSGNRGEGQAMPAIQCAISGQPCRP